MKKSKIFQAVATVYVVLGILFLMLIDANIFFGILTVICFMGAAGYHDIANNYERKETILENEWYENGQYPDY